MALQNQRAMKFSRTFLGAAVTAASLVAMASHVSAATAAVPSSLSSSNVDGLRGASPRAKTGGQRKKKRSLEGQAMPVATADTPSNYVATDGATAEVDANATETTSAIDSVGGFRGYVDSSAYTAAHSNLEGHTLKGEIFTAKKATSSWSQYPHYGWYNPKPSDKSEDESKKKSSKSSPSSSSSTSSKGTKASSKGTKASSKGTKSSKGSKSSKNSKGGSPSSSSSYDAGEPITTPDTSGGSKHKSGADDDINGTTGDSDDRHNLWPSYSASSDDEQKSGGSKHKTKVSIDESASSSGDGDDDIDNGSTDSDDSSDGKYYCTVSQVKHCYDPCKDESDCAQMKEGKEKDRCKLKCWDKCCRDDDSDSKDDTTGGSKHKSGDDGDDKSRSATDQPPHLRLCSTDAERKCRDDCFDKKCDSSSGVFTDCHRQCRYKCCDDDRDGGKDSADSDDDKSVDSDDSDDSDDGQCHKEGEKAVECGADPKDGRFHACCKGLKCSDDRTCVKDPNYEPPSKSKPKPDDSDDGVKLCNTDAERKCRDDCFDKKCDSSSGVFTDCHRECRYKCCDADDGVKDSNDSNDSDDGQCHKEGEKAVECGADPKDGRFHACCKGLKCSDDRTCVKDPEYIPSDSDDGEDDDDDTPLCNTNEETECRDKCYEQNCDIGEKQCRKECRLKCCEEEDSEESGDTGGVTRPSEDSNDGQCHKEGEKAVECGADPKEGRFDVCCEGYICSDDRTCVKDPDAPPDSDDEDSDDTPLCNTDEENECKLECYEKNCDDGEQQCRKECRQKCCERTEGSRPSSDEGRPTRAPTRRPTGTAAPTREELSCNGINQGERARIIFMRLSLISDPEDMLNLDTPQGRAYDWIVSKDERRLCPLEENLEQRYALAVLYYSTEGDDWADCSARDDDCEGSRAFPGAEPWLSKESECAWAGISCNARSEVRNMELPDNNLRGSIPDEIQVFSSLDIIGLEDNKIGGTIPDTFNESLIRLRLNNNRLTGEIPSSLPSRLIALYLNSNELEGTLDSVIGSLSNMRQLQLNDNQLTGDIPNSLADMKNLRIARFEENMIEGSMPNRVCRQKEEADDNEENGDSDYLMWLSVDCDKVECDCCSPSCDGETAPTPDRPSAPSPTPRPPTPPSGSPGDGICPGISDDDRIQQIFDELSEISDQDELNDLDTPQGKSIVWLVTEDEKQLCPGDDTLAQRYILSVLYYSTSGDDWTDCSQDDNSCDRNGDSWLSESSECNWGGVQCNMKGFVETIELDVNNLDGTIPIEMKDLEFLDILNFENNRLRGEIPEEFNDTLVRLRLNKNRLSGTIPGTLSSRLVALYLADNNLEGTLDDLLEGSQLLNRLELENNSLSGDIPPSLSDLTSLKIARFNGNDFEGSMPDEVCNNPDQNIAILAVDCDKVECDCCTPACAR